MFTSKFVMIVSNYLFICSGWLNISKYWFNISSGFPSIVWEKGISLFAGQTSFYIGALSNAATAILIAKL
jgi:hypothetical protein